MFGYVKPFSPPLERFVLTGAQLLAFKACCLKRGSCSSLRRPGLPISTLASRLKGLHRPNIATVWAGR